MNTINHDSDEQTTSPPRSLQDVLNKYSGEGTQFGGPEDPKAKQHLQSFQEELITLEKRNAPYFRLLFGAILVLLLVQVVLSVINFNTMKQDVHVYKGLISGIFGVTSGGLINLLIGLYKDKTRTETLLLLSRNANNQTMQTIINIIAKNKK